MTSVRLAISVLITLIVSSSPSFSQTFLFDNWKTLEVEESPIIGGKTKYVYRLDGDDSTFTTTNVTADVIGIIKTSNQVFPEQRGDGYCARMEVIEEEVKVLGMINLRVIAQGSVITGKLYEPIKDTKSPYSKMNYGVPFTEKPYGIKYDFKAEVGHEKIRSTGFSSRKELGIPDYADIVVLLQKRWEDADGNIYAKRVGTAYKRIKESVQEWINGEILPIHYGDISGNDDYQEYMGLRRKGSDLANYALNSQGKSVTIEEIGWADESEEPTHIIISFSASEGKAFHGGIGNKLWIDNVEIVHIRH